MKHNFLKIALVAAVVATAGYGVYENQRQDMMSEVMMENLEALARYELPDVEITCNKNDYIAPGQCWAPDGECFRLMQYYQACRFTGYQYMYCTSICNI